MNQQATLDRSETQRFSVLHTAGTQAILWDHEEGEEVARYDTRDEAVKAMGLADDQAWAAEIVRISAEWAKPWPTDPR